MKNISKIIVLLLFNLFCGTIYSQIYTPNGTSVDYIIGTYNAANAASAESQAANWLSARGWTNDVIKTAPATGEYNCHSYAWYRSEGGTGNYWVNAFTNADINNFNPYSYNSTPPAPNNIEQYWEDNSYVEVPESSATKVWYGSCWTWNNYYGWENSCDHSAVRIISGTHAGKYESKWGAWPRYIHPADKSPYNTSNRKYYIKSCPTLVNFTNQIVTTNTTVTSCGDINVENVQVKNGAKLTLDAAGKVNIISDFKIDLDSECEIIIPCRQDENEVILGPEFEVAPGGTFEINMKDCE